MSLFMISIDEKINYWHQYKIVRLIVLYKPLQNKDVVTVMVKLVHQELELTGRE